MKFNYKSFNRLRYGSIGIMVLVILITSVYTNCGKMDARNGSKSSLSSRSLSDLDLFGAQTGNVDVENLNGTIGFSKSEITEGETVELSWKFKYGRSNGFGYRLANFGCTAGLLSSDPSFIGSASYLNPQGGCNSQTGVCSWEATGQVTLKDIKASSAPYSCQVNFFEDVSTVITQFQSISVSLKVNDKGSSSGGVVAANQCEGNERIQGNFERCNDTHCLGWAFNYGNIASIVKINISQTGEYNKNASVEVTTDYSRSDVNAHLAQQGCLNSGNVLTQFMVPRSNIDTALRNATTNKGSGTGQNIQLQAFVEGSNGALQPIGVISNYQPLTSTNQSTSRSVIIASAPYNKGIDGYASNFPENTLWCLASGGPTCTPNLSGFKDWRKVSNKGNGNYDWSYTITPYQAGWCPGSYTAVVQVPGESPYSSTFKIQLAELSAASNGLKVYNVPPISLGVLKGCFEYDRDYSGQNKPGSCGGRGSAKIIGSGWSYNTSTYTASFDGDVSVFGGRHGTIYFTYEYSCGPTQTISQSF